ncbi:McrB family protein, partial [Bacteroidota bacterium]
GRINQVLSHEKSDEWKNLNQERSNWFSAPWNKWQEYLQDSASSLQNESAFQLESSRFEPDDFNTYIAFLRVVVRHFGIKKGDSRVVFSVRPRRLNFTVGQRYCFNLYLSNPEGRFGAISADKLHDDSQRYVGTPPQPYYNYWKSFDATTEEKNSILKGTEMELSRTSKSGYRKYNNENFENYVFEEDIEKHTSMVYPLNTILYGPPGTGKTYLTVKRAAEIVSDRAIDNYSEALTIFNEHLHKRIEFITFHQNYSYEDFIQGLRPNTKTGDQLTFLKEDGVFKKIADRALKNLEEASAAPTELGAAARFKAGLDKLVDKIQDHEDNFPITDAVHIFEVEEDAFRYNGENWTAHPTGIRMKFTDLEEFYKKEVKSRKDVKVLENVSGLAKQHATYYFKVYDLILKLIPAKVNVDKSVQKQNFVIVIDEINRANISRVFGELITLIEPDKRSHGTVPLKAKLPSGDTFTVPSNLYIIGTMNTADKSIALLDIALRRRFEFEAMYPNYNLDGVYDAEILEKINKEIIEGKGHDFQIGHAYFMGDNKDLVKRMNKKVIPLLLEYYMNDDKEVTRILTKAGLQVNTAAWPLEITGKA